MKSAVDLLMRHKFQQFPENLHIFGLFSIGEHEGLVGNGCFVEGPSDRIAIEVFDVIIGDDDSAAQGKLFLDRVAALFQDALADDDFIGFFRFNGNPFHGEPSSSFLF